MVYEWTALDSKDAGGGVLDFGNCQGTGGGRVGRGDVLQCGS